MLRRGQANVSWSRLVASARARRAIVYLLTAALIVTAAVFGVRLALPPDPYAPVHVQRVPGVSSQEGAATTEVTYDAESERAAVSVQEADGTIRRYYVEQVDGQWQIEPVPETPP